MMIELPVPWIIALNVFTLPAIQLACAWTFTRLPAKWFDAPPPDHCCGHTITPGLLKKWKRLLPDGAAWFANGFRKHSLESYDPVYLRRFAAETRRGEWCHWTAMMLCLIPFFWNPWWGCLIIGLYALIGNVPCILLQRVNRARLLRLLAVRSQASRAEEKSARS